MRHIAALMPMISINQDIDDHRVLLQHPFIKGVMIIQGDHDIAAVAHKVKVLREINRELLIFLKPDNKKIDLTSHQPSWAALLKAYKYHPQDGIAMIRKAAQKRVRSLGEIGVNGSFDINCNINDDCRTNHIHIASCMYDVLAVLRYYIEAQQKLSWPIIAGMFPCMGSIINRRLSLDHIREHALLPFLLFRDRLDGILLNNHIYPQIDDQCTVMASSHWIDQIIRNEINFKQLLFGFLSHDYSAHEVIDVLSSGCDVMIMALHDKRIQEICGFDDLMVRPSSLSQLKKIKPRIIKRLARNIMYYQRKQSNCYD